MRDCFTEALGFLRGKLKEAVEAYSPASAVNEIRLRRGLALSVTANGRNVLLGEHGKATAAEPLVCSPADLEFAANRLCEGSVYRHMPTLCEGYAVTPGGLRVGICGSIVYIDGRKASVNTFSSVNIRIPRAVHGCADSLARKYENRIYSVLVYSPPGEGKTTFVRDLALTLSRHIRVAVIDEKYELFPPESSFTAGGVMLDVLSGYRKAHGIELATRTLSPQIIICDEIGLEDDIPAILSMQNSGVRLIATVHAASRSELTRKPTVKCLMDNGVFELFVGLSRRRDGSVEVRVEQ